MGISYTAYAAYGWDLSTVMSQAEAAFYRDAEGGAFDPYDWAEELFKNAPAGLSYLVLGHYDVEERPLLAVVGDTVSVECYDVETIPAFATAARYNDVVAARKFLAGKGVTGLPAPQGFLGMSVG